jgi:endonuclease/exonuclease/phosphatase family metal-dependent hydrolase
MTTFAPASVVRFARPVPVSEQTDRTALSIATYNIEHAIRLEQATVVAREEPRLAHADLLALQEVDERAADRIAAELGMGYVYYPALRHPRTNRNFGPALLSRWPVLEDHRLDLPHRGLHGVPRISVAATVQVQSHQISVHVVHFGTMREILMTDQDDQARAVLADAARRNGPAIIMGDLNRKGLGRLFKTAGWRWVTERVGPTHFFWSFDHVFLRGFDGREVESGSLRSGLAASDHRAVWTQVELPRPTASSPSAA